MIRLNDTIIQESFLKNETLGDWFFILLIIMFGIWLVLKLMKVLIDNPYTNYENSKEFEDDEDYLKIKDIKVNTTNQEYEVLLGEPKSYTENIENILEEKETDIDDDDNSDIETEQSYEEKMKARGVIRW